MIRRITKKRIGELLVEQGTITGEQLATALAEQQAQGELLGRILVRLGHVTEEQVAQVLTAQYGFPYLPLDNYEIDQELTAVVSEDVARQYCLLPVDRIGNALTLAMADPSNGEAIAHVERTTHCIVQAFVSTPSAILKAIDKYYGHPTNGDGACQA